MLWFRSEMSSKVPGVEDLIPNIVVFRSGGMKGDWLTRVLISSVDFP